MKKTTVYYVTSQPPTSREQRVHMATLFQPEAEKIATDVYRTDNILCEIHANERTPIDWSVLPKVSTLTSSKEAPTEPVIIDPPAPFIIAPQRTGA